MTPPTLPTGDDLRALFDPRHLRIEAWPPGPTRGMLVPRIKPQRGAGGFGSAAGDDP